MSVPATSKPVPKMITSASQDEPSDATSLFPMTRCTPGKTVTLG
jgi:hypothetical protein